MKHVFGPVPSRRLGRSLGVDLVPFKTCTYDCIYCQLGRTTCRTIERKEWVPLEDTLAEIRPKLSSRPDYVTLGGSGEPTLFSRIGDLIDGIKTMTNVPVAVLTNGSLLWQPETRRALQDADLLIPSLDAGDEEGFRRINRPHEAISFEQMLDGLIASRQMFDGRYWLEVFVLAGYTDAEAEMKKLSDCVGLIKPDRVQLNTATRPLAEGSVEGVSPEHLTELAAVFDPPAEVIANSHRVHGDVQFAASREEILDTLRRRPCSLEDLAAGLGLRRSEVLKYVDELHAERIVETTWNAGECYYRMVN